MNDDGFQLGDLFAMARRRGKVVGVIAGLVLLAAIFVAAILPNEFESYTTLLVEPQSISKRLVEGGVEGGEMTSRLHLMTMQILSRSRLSRVIDDLGLYGKESEERTREQVIDLMRSQIRVEPVLPELERGLFRRYQGEINTFRLFYRHESAPVAAAVANRLANDFIDEHIRDRVKVSGDTAEFIEAELERLAQRTREVEGQIATVKAENAGSLPEDLLTSQTRLGRTYEALRAAAQRLGEAESDVAFFQQQAKVARLVEGGRSDIIGRAATPALRLRELEIALGSLRARGLTDRHPDVVIAEAEAAEIRARMNDEESEASPPTSMAEQEALAQVERARQRAEAGRAEIERLQQEISGIEESMAATPRVAEQLDGLQREWASLSQSYALFSEKRLEASVASNMERRQKGEQFRVLESAYAATDPISPNRRMIVVMGLLFGLGAGIFVGLALEISDRSFHEPRRVQQTLRAPVLAAIPAIRLAADRAAMRRRWLREAFAAATVAGVMLVTSAFGYVYVNRPGLLGIGGGEQAAPATPTPSPTTPAPIPATPPAPPAAAAPAAAAPAAPSGG